jgi:hypothetical protein
VCPCPGTTRGRARPGTDQSLTLADARDTVGQRSCWSRDIRARPTPQLGTASRARRSLRRIHTAGRESARDQGEQLEHGGHPGEPFRTGPAAGQSRARTRTSPVPLVLAALLVGAVGARVALAPSRSDAVGALAATVETWMIFGRGGTSDQVDQLTSMLGAEPTGLGPGHVAGRRCPTNQLSTCGDDFREARRSVRA